MMVTCYIHWGDTTDRGWRGYDVEDTVKVGRRNDTFLCLKGTLATVDNEHFGGSLSSTINLIYFVLSFSGDTERMMNRPLKSQP